MRTSTLALYVLFMSIVACSVVLILSPKDSLRSLGKVSNQKKYTMYLGTNDKDTLKQELPTEAIREQMHEICMRHADGYTVSIMEGYYRDGAGNPTHEVTLVYVFFDTPLESVKKIMDEAQVKFNQSSILLEESKSKSIFYQKKD
ncbi:MAG: hypothetical protein IKD73_09190 [Selenomonadaceae bacterium]|nr:hypothetical protein [Selenomonadaceae bacterium]